MDENTSTVASLEKAEEGTQQVQEPVATTENVEKTSSDPVVEKNEVEIPKATREKYSKLESENSKFKEMSSKQEQVFKNRVLRMQQDEGYRTKFDAIYKDDPEEYEVFRQQFQKIYGRDLGDHATLYGSTLPQTQTVAPQTKGGLTAMDAHAIYAERRAEDKFFAVNPDIDPDLATTSEERTQRIQDLATVKVWAQDMVKSGRAVSYVDALNKAYKSYNIDNILAQERQKGEKAGQAIAQNRGVGSIGQARGGSANVVTSSVGGLSPAQQAQYESIKSTSPKAAEIFLKTVQQY